MWGHGKDVACLQPFFNIYEINAVLINNLNYADDAVIIANYEKELQEKTKQPIL